MYLRFAFEDGVKIGLKGWQAMTRAERLALSHFPVDTDDERAAFVQVREARRALLDEGTRRVPPKG